MANTLVTVLRNSQSPLIHNLLIHSRNTMFKPQVIRKLYSPTTLGLDSYSQQKDRIKQQLANIAPKFREKMQEYTADDSKNMVFTEDLKNMLHLAENDDDVTLVIKMMKRFNQQNKQLRFGNYVFGPVIMRMFYSLNKPEEAYECFKAPELNGLFDQLITYQILMDLLYENQRYNEILKTFEMVKDRQIEGIKFAKNVVVLTLAACYKLNTKESLEFALKLWSELNEIGHLPMRRATTFCAGLAVNQGKPEVALEILSSARNSNYTTIRNLKAVALIDMGRVEDALQVLKGILNEDSASSGPVHTFNREVVDKVKAAVEKLDNTDIKLEFSRIEKYFQGQGHICDSSLDEQLCQTIATPPVIRKPGEGFQNQSRFSRFQRNERDGSSNREGNRTRTFETRFQRPGLADLQ